MRDERGLYYHAQAGNPAVKVYVRKGTDGIEFRLWDAKRPEVWDSHEWLPYDVLRSAAALYKQERNANSDPLALYDIAIARALLEEKA